MSQSIFQKLANIWNPKTTREQEVRGVLSNNDYSAPWNNKRGEYASKITGMTANLTDNVRSEVNSILGGLISLPFRAAKLANDLTLGTVTKVGTRVLGKVVQAPVKLLFSGALITAAEGIEKTDAPFRITGYIRKKTNNVLDKILNKVSKPLTKN